MKTILLNSSKKKKTPTLCFSKNDFFFCLLITILASINHVFFRQPLLYLLKRMYRPLGAIFQKYPKLIISSLVLIGICYVFSGVLIVSSSYTTMLEVKTFSFAVYLIHSISSLLLVGVFVFGDATAVPSPKNAIRFWSVALGDEFFHEDLSREFFGWNLWASCLMMMQLIFSVVGCLLGTGSLVFGLPLLLMLVFFDKEQIEHIKAHSPGGQLFSKHQKSGFKFSCLWLSEAIRTYILWPLALWHPNYYYCTHVLIHHRENNGLCDFQSTRRFPSDRFTGFTQAVTWNCLFIGVLPVDIVRYLSTNCGKKKLWMFLRGYLLGVFCIFAVFLVSTPFACVLLFLLIFNGIDEYRSIYRWHGFDEFVDGEYQNLGCAPSHSAHHSHIRVHCEDKVSLTDTFWRNNHFDKGELPLFRSSRHFKIFTKNWVLYVALMWQKKYEVINNFICLKIDTKTEFPYHYYAPAKDKQMSFLEEHMGQRIGYYLECLLKGRLSVEEVDIFYDRKNLNTQTKTNVSDVF